MAYDYHAKADIQSCCASSKCSTASITFFYIKYFYPDKKKSKRDMKQNKSSKQKALKDLRLRLRHMKQIFGYS